MRDSGKILLYDDDDDDDGDNGKEEVIRNILVAAEGEAELMIVVPFLGTCTCTKDTNARVVSKDVITNNTTSSSDGSNDNRRRRRRLLPLMMMVMLMLILCSMNLASKTKRWNGTNSFGSNTVV